MCTVKNNLFEVFHIDQHKNDTRGNSLIIFDRLIKKKEGIIVFTVNAKIEPEI